MNGFNTRRAARMAGILLISLIALIHLVVAPEHFKAAPWIGWSFLVLILGAGVSAVGIEQDARWGWLLGVLTAGGSFAALVISRTVGLPGFPEAVGKWAPLAIYTLFVEVLFIGIYPAAPKDGNVRHREAPRGSYSRSPSDDTSAAERRKKA